MAWRDPRDGNPVKTALAVGETVVGSFVRMPTIEAVEICAHAGCQFLIIDNEHTPVDWERTAAMILAAEAAGTTSIVRLPTWGRERITKALDAGADGVMIPQVEDGRVTSEVVAATRYGPSGTRGTATNRNSGYGMKMSLPEYIDAANQSTLVIVQIESVEGVSKAGEIAAVDGVDCIFVGLSDLSVRLGVPGQMEAPALLGALAEVGAACVRHGKALGVPVGSAEMARSVPGSWGQVHCHRRCRSVGEGNAPVRGGGGAIRRLTREQTRFFFDRNIEPIAELASGETIVVETQDAHGGSITSTDTVYRNLDEVFELLGGANPVTGPIAIAGASPGDCLEIELDHVEGAPVRGFGHMTTTPTLHPDLKPETTICHREGDHVVLPTVRGPIRVPYLPFVGTLGVAPAGDPVPSFGQRPDILGNVDLPELTDGAIVVLQVQVPGGLVSLGDAHLVQGDAEIHRSAVETQADVTLTIHRRSAGASRFAKLPQVNSNEFIGSVAPGPGHLEDLVRAAYDDLAVRLERFYGFSQADAFRLLGAVGKVRIGQVVPPVYSALAKIERKYLEVEPR